MKLRPDERATRIYRDVLGDDVLEACLLPEDARSLVDDDGGLPIHGEAVLVLRNGRRVRLWATEWGGLHSDNGEGFCSE